MISKYNIVGECPHMLLCSDQLQLRNEAKRYLRLWPE